MPRLVSATVKCNAGLSRRLEILPSVRTPGLRRSRGSLSRRRDWFPPGRLNEVQTPEELRDVYQHFLLHYSLDVPEMQEANRRRKRKEAAAARDDNPDNPAEKEAAEESDDEAQKLKHPVRKRLFDICREVGLGERAPLSGFWGRLQLACLASCPYITGPDVATNKATGAASVSGGFAASRLPPKVSVNCASPQLRRM